MPQVMSGIEHASQLPLVGLVQEVSPKYLKRGLMEAERIPESPQGKWHG